MTLFIVLHYRMIVGVYDSRELAEEGKSKWIKRYPSDKDSVTIHRETLNETDLPA